MLGMFSTATPSRDRLLRSSGVPQHWRRNSGRSGTSACARCARGIFLSLQKSWRSRCSSLTSIVRLSLSFLQDAEMVSEVANSKYHSLFFILHSGKQQNKKDSTLHGTLSPVITKLFRSQGATLAETNICCRNSFILSFFFTEDRNNSIKLTFLRFMLFYWNV